MKYIDKNLSYSFLITDLDNNVIPFGYNQFPDGQVQIKIHKDFLDDGYNPIKVQASIYNSTALDLFLQILETFNVAEAKVNYLYGARSDKDVAGDYYVANVAKLFLSYLALFDTKFKFLAPHCHDLCNKMINAQLIFDLPDCVNLDDYDYVIFPDESAQERFQNINKPYIVCEKERDQETSKILSHVIPDLPDHVKRVIVIDDLCDAGSSFISVKNAIPSHIKADLFIFHGVFTGCAPLRLFKHYDNIFVSNSLPHIQEMKTVFDLWKNKTISYKDACGVFCVDDFVQYKDFVPGNLVLFDVWN
jgi:ribose-phosphate pyrophosphokinase